MGEYWKGKFIHLTLRKDAHVQIFPELLKIKKKTIEEVLTSTHNQWFGAKIRKNRYIPVNPSFAI